MRVCDFPDCGRKHHAKGSCLFHYIRKWNTDNPNYQRNRVAKYYIENRERILQKAIINNKIYYSKNKDNIKRKVSEYVKQNKHKVYKRIKEWSQKNRDKCRYYAKNYYRNNPEKAVEKCALRRARKLSATPAWANDFFIQEIYHLAKLRTKHTGFKWHVDHIVPLKSKLVCGLHWEKNLQVIPAYQNISKCNLHWPGMPT